MTAGSVNSPPSRRQARAHPPRLNRSPSRSAHATRRPPSRLRAVTASRSADVRNRSIATDRPTGTTSSARNHSPNTGTNTSMLSAMNAEMKWAIGEMRMTTACDSAGAVMPASWHAPGI